jgi:hypothetical protein
MRKLGKILRLSDPYPNFEYEFLCYVKAFLGGILIIIGFFFLLSSLFKQGLIIFGFELILSSRGMALLDWEERILGQNFEVITPLIGTFLILFCLFFFWRIRLVRNLL